MPARGVPQAGVAALDGEAVRCLRCGERVRSVQIDDTEERVLTSETSSFVAVQMPGMVGYTTTFAFVVHACKRGRT